MILPLNQVVAEPDSTDNTDVLAKRHVEITSRTTNAFLSLAAAHPVPDVVHNVDRQCSAAICLCQLLVCRLRHKRQESGTGSEYLAGSESTDRPLTWLFKGAGVPITAPAFPTF
jgi:hypothetical protein